jgi:lipopolysaccharide export system permease protein
VAAFDVRRGEADYPRTQSPASKQVRASPARAARPDRRSARPAGPPGRRVIFQRSLLRELGGYAAAAFAVLFALLVTVQLVRMLSRAAGGRIPTDAIVALLGFTALNYLPFLLALTLFVSVLMAVSRSYRDSEMVVWSTAGVALAAWVRPVLAFAAPIVALVTLMALFLTPWANQRAQEYRRTLESREEVSRIAPGVFLESANAEQVFFAEGVDGEKGLVRNIFLAQNRRGRSGVVVSREGFIEEADNGERFAVLLNGRQYDGIPGTGEYRVVEFERAALRIQAREVPARGRHPKTVPTLELLETKDSVLRAELMSRIGLPFVALNLALLAIPLAFVNPRASRVTSLIFAWLASTVYQNLQGVLQAWVAQGRISFEIGWWILHAAMLGLTMFLFLWRNTLGFRLWLPR